MLSGFDKLNVNIARKMARNRSGTTFTKEQLQSLGCVTKELQQSHTQICPIFPLLMNKPLELENNAARDYKILWKEGFQTYMHECYSSSELKNAVRDDYSTKVANNIEKERKRNLKIKFAWNLMPQELRPTSKRKSSSSVVKPNLKEKKPKTVDIETKLKILEQKEKELPVEEEESEKKKQDSESEEEVEDEDKMDPELEDDLDYGNNYFDNGEGYDEDDGDDGEGPIY